MRVWLPVLPRPGDLKADLVDLLQVPPIQHVENRTLSVLGAWVPAVYALHFATQIASLSF